MESELRSSIFAIRQTAREIGLRAAGLELRLARDELPAIELAESVKDSRLAGIYARRYIQLWHAKYNRALADNPKGATEFATKAAQSRLETIGTTETFRAFNEERRNVIQHIVGDVRSNIEIVEIWDAMMDACPACWEKDGSEAINGSSFPSGDVPGEVHPNCRCTSHIITRYR